MVVAAGGPIVGRPGGVEMVEVGNQLRQRVAGVAVEQLPVEGYAQGVHQLKPGAACRFVDQQTVLPQILRGGLDVTGSEGLARAVE